MADDSALTDIVRRAAQANAKLYKGWMDLTMEYMRSLSEIFGGATMPAQSSTATQEMDAGPSTLILEGELGAAATGSFLVSNDLDRLISCKLTSTDFADPTGTPAKVRAAFEPPSLELAPGEQRVVKVVITIDESLRPGVGYVGEIAIAGMEGFAVPVVLRRQHVPAEGDFDADDGLSATDEARNPPSQKEGSTPPTGRSASTTAKRTKGAARGSAKSPTRKTERRR